MATSERARRRDAATNRARILTVGRRFLVEDRLLQLNEVAREANVGVATVYRHFPSPSALLEELARPGLEALAAMAQQAAANPDAWAGLTEFLEGALHAQLHDPAIPQVLAGLAEASSDTVELITDLQSMLIVLVSKGQAAGSVSSSVRAADLFPLMCGIAYAGKLRQASSSPDADAPNRYLAALLNGLGEPSGT